MLSDIEGAVIADRYRLTRRLLTDHLGEVWEAAATQPATRRVRVRFWRVPAGLSEAQWVGLSGRMVKDAMRAANVEHRAFVPIYEYGRFDDTPFVIMAWLDGLRLSDWLERHGKATPRQAADVALVLLSALVKAHGIGLVDRSIDARRLFIERVNNSWRLRLPDFGIASAEELLGPSNAGHPVDDVRGVGEVMFHMLVGCSAADLTADTSTPEQWRGPSVGRYLDDQVNQRFIAMVDRARSPNRSERFSSAAAMEEALSYSTIGFPLTGSKRPLEHQLLTLPPEP